MATRKKTTKEKIISNKEVTRELLPHLARQRALANPIDENVYQVSAGWELDALKQDKNICVVMGCAALEEAIQDPDKATVLIPKDAAVTTQAMQDIIKRNAIETTIFVEA